MKIETILVRMAYLAPVMPVGEILAALESLEQKLQQGLPSGGKVDAGPSQAKQPPEYEPTLRVREAADPPPPKIISESTEVGYAAAPAPGDDLKKFIKREHPPLGAKIDAAEILGLENGCLTLGFPRGYIFLESLMEKPQKEELERIAGIYYSQKVSLKITTIDAPKANGNGGGRSAKANHLNDIKREAVNSPLFQKVLAEFEGAELVEIKPITDRKQGG